MNTLKVSVFAVLLSGMYLASCQKDHDKVTDTPATANSTKAADAASLKIKEPEKLFERTFKVFDASKTKSTTLRLRAASQQTLDRLNLQDMEFTLVNTPAHVLQQTTTPGTSPKQGAALSSKQGASRDAKGPGALNIPDNAIVMDFPFETTNGPISIEVSGKAPKTQQLTTGPDALSLATSYLYLYGSSWHRVKVTNLTANLIYTTFYYHFGNYGYYSGYAYNLYLNGYSYYYNCNYSVGVHLTFYNAYHYRYDYWINC
jgi:hypothetical protein